MALDVDALKTEVRALGFATTDITDDNLASIINHCVKAYSDYRPLPRCTVLSAVKDQHDYDPPAGWHTIQDVLWNPSLNVSSWWPMWVELAERFSGNVDFDYPSQIKIFHDKMRDYNTNWGGHWRLMGDAAGDEKIRLFPAPDTTGTRIPVIWGEVHTPSTLPNRDRDLMFSGVLAYCEYSKGFAQQKASGSGWSAGTYRVTGDSGKFLMGGATSRIMSWKFRLANGGYGRRSA